MTRTDMHCDAIQCLLADLAFTVAAILALLQWSVWETGLVPLRTDRRAMMLGLVLISLLV